MNELALFAGAGGGLLGSTLLGHSVVCAVERDEYCQHVLVQRQNDRVLPSFPIWDDICTFDGSPFRGTVDLVTGGFPCQAFSNAARGRNIPEKNLWEQMLRVVREVAPGLVFAENVSEAPIQRAKQDLEASGYKCAYKRLAAKDLGADHIRPRYWLLAHADHDCELLRPVNAEAQGVSELQNGVWKTYPGELGVVDGVAARMDRLKAVGNGQVPLVAAAAFIMLMQEAYNDSLPRFGD